MLTEEERELVQNARDYGAGISQLEDLLDLIDRLTTQPPAPQPKEDGRGE